MSVELLNNLFLDVNREVFKGEFAGVLRFADELGDLYDGVVTHLDFVEVIEVTNVEGTM